MLSPERIYSLYKSAEYVAKYRIPGDIVECGTWKGGSAMMIAFTLLLNKCSSKKIYLYDTYSGMPKPSTKDISYAGKSAKEKWNKMKKNKYNEWCYSALEEVKKNVFSTGYPKKNIIFVKGKVENTLPYTILKRISLLHLDTDWYKSTLHELINLFPYVVKHGVLLIDDYGHWQGAREAVDSYFKEKKVKILLIRTDHSGRVALKL